MKKNCFINGLSLVMLVQLLYCSGCGYTIDRLKNIGKEPKLSYLTVPKISEAHEAQKSNNNSLWSPSSRLLFQNNRAGKIGDIIKIKININDNAKLGNTTVRSRKNTENLNLLKMFGIEKPILGALGSGSKPEELVNTGSTSSNSGTGTIDRSESINTEIAAIVQDVYENGNMLIKGTQEIKVNFEIRQVVVQGLVKAEDISIDNVIDASKIAELRVYYGGRGQHSDVQQPRLGSQIIDIVSPF